METFYFKKTIFLCFSFQTRNELVLVMEKYLYALVKF